MKVAILPAVCLAAVMAAPAAADELRLRNGDRITGTLVRLTPDRCTFRTPYQATLEVKSGDVARLVTSPGAVVVSTAGDRIVGTVTAEGAGRVSVRSPRFGTLVLNASDVGEVLGQGMAVADSGAPPPEVRGRGLTVPPDPQVAQASPPPAADRPIGERPAEAEEDIRQFFLRESAVLLGPGEVELELPVTYARDQRGPERSRDVILTPSLRVGLADRLEGYLNVPVAWGDRQVLLEDRFGRADRAGLGDVGGGLKYLVVPEDAFWPDVIASVGFTAPTGKEGDRNDPTLVDLGGGRWLAGASLTLVRSYDPAVLFGSLGYTRAFDHEAGGVAISGGHLYAYGFGVGFALNQQLTLSGQFTGAYITETNEDGRAVPGSTREPMSLRSSLTYRLARDQFLEPSVTYGLNDDAPDVVLTLSYIGRIR